jgi:hypothetical protein
MKKEADRLRTYGRWPVSFMDKNDMSAAALFVCRLDMLHSIDIATLSLLAEC